MKRLFAFFAFLLISLPGFSQQRDSIQEPLIPADKIELLKNINITFGMRMEYQAYTFRGGDNYYNGLQFSNGFTALGISGKLHERLSFQFRNRFNKNSDVQTLDRLGGNIELAYIDVKLSPKFNLLLGRMTAFYGGYEYEFSALDVLEYNDIYGNALAFVTGAGITYQATEDHKFGFQVLNSRTTHYDDLYGDIEADNIEEPDWPVAFVGNWRGSFFDGKLQTIYSLSHSYEVKSRGTTFITLGHKYENENLSIMYDFHYSYEEVDTKGIITGVISNEQVSEDVSYMENWMRAEYQFSPKFRGLLTLMTSTAYDNVKSSNDHIRTSYGAIPTIYYSPFKKLDLRFYLAYIGRYYDYSSFAEETYGVRSYNKNEVRIGFIAPLLLL
ncbi:porin [Christiangramia sediminicola]|uniref:Porin n=1 Tax=Christiangramia sediminicola TaxID=3073267 RepID=A0ABU1ENF5_9FLAO|nr:porin [Christiangramia sp. SM2212]MDR5589920.1 porin [Christiangramia sp. SM2212]